MSTVCLFILVARQPNTMVSGLPTATAAAEETTLVCFITLDTHALFKTSGNLEISSFRLQCVQDNCELWKKRALTWKNSWMVIQLILQFGNSATFLELQLSDLKITDVMIWPIYILSFFKAPLWSDFLLIRKPESALYIPVKPIPQAIPQSASHRYFPSHIVQR